MVNIQVLRLSQRIILFLSTLQRSILLWEKPLSAGLLSGLIFLGIATTAGVPWRLSKSPYFNYLADAFLHGQLSLRLMPPSTLDLSLYQGKYFLYWGPLPAVLVMPFVQVFGVGVSDVLQSIVVGSVNVTVFALLVRQACLRGMIDLSPLQRALLVLFFALGTAHTSLPALGNVWYLLQLVAVCFTLLAYLAAVSFENGKAFFWTGCAMAGVLTTRSSAVFVGIFLAWYLLYRHWNSDYRRIIRYCLIGLAPVTAAFLLLLLYNFARFGSPFDNGLQYHLMKQDFRQMYEAYGVLNVHYIPVNLYYNFVYYPFVTLRQQWVLGVGGSLFLLSPLYFSAVAALWQHRKDWNTWFLFLSVLVGSFPALMVMAPGSFMFGPRYLLDIAPPLLILTAMGMKRCPNWLAAVCVTISVLHYLVGALMMVHAWK